MKKALLILLMAILANCSDQSPEPETHNWLNQPITFVVVPLTTEKLQEKLKRHNYPLDRYGFAAWIELADGTKYCSVFIDERYIKDEEKIGHEAKHCLFGNFHKSAKLE